MAPRAQLTDSLIASPPIVPDLQSDNAAVAEYILSNWETSDKPVIWADGRAGPPCVPDEFTHIDCDFAVFRRDRWRFEADLLYFGRRSPAEALLRTWVAFCRSFPAIDGTTLLDQAWCLVTSQACLDTLWLARSGNPGLPRRFSPVEDQEDRADGQICSAGLSADQFFKGRLKVARAAERTGFPEVLLSAPAAPGTDRRAIAIIRDVTSQDSRALGAMIEALATTFVAEPGGFRQLEIAICARREELYAALQSAPVDRALVVTPNHTVAPDTFRRLAEANNGMVIAAPSAIIVDMASYRSHRSSDILESVGST